MPVSLPYIPQSGSAQDYEVQYWIVAEAHNGLAENQKIREELSQSGSVWKSADGVVLDPAPDTSKLTIAGQLLSTDRPVIKTVDFRPVQAKTTGAATMPAVGENVAVQVDNPNGFIDGDLVQLAAIDGDSANVTAVAVFSISSISGNTLSLQALDRSGIEGANFIAAAGDNLPAQSEITGQTRLPDIPPEAQSAEIFVMPSNTLAWERSSQDPNRAGMRALAEKIGTEAPLASFSYKSASNEDIDSLKTYGVPLNIAAQIIANGVSRMDSLRIFSEVPIYFAPYFKVVYY